jgi:hypothetical protein
VLKYYLSYTIGLSKSNIRNDDNNNLRLNNRSHDPAATTACVLLLLSVFLLICTPLSIGYKKNNNSSINILAFASSSSDGVGNGGDHSDGGGGGSSSTSSSSDSSSSKKKESSDSGSHDDDKKTESKNDGNNPSSNDKENNPTTTKDNTGGGNNQNQDNKDKNNKPKCPKDKHYDKKLKECVVDNINANEIPISTDQQQQQQQQQVQKNCGIKEQFDENENKCVKNTTAQQQELAKKLLGCTGETHFDAKRFMCIDNSKRDYGGSCVPGWHPTIDPGSRDPILCEKDITKSAKDNVPTKTNATTIPVNNNSTSSSSSSSSSKTTVNIINKKIIEGTQPIGSSSSSGGGGTSGSNITGKLFREFNNSTNIATGLVVTDTTITKNQFVNGQVEITGHIQNIRPASISTTDTSTATNANSNNNNNDINTARTIVVIATFYDIANNVLGVQYGASDPNTLIPGQSGVFHLIVNNIDSIDHVTYLVQWLGISGQNAVLHPTVEEVNSAATATATTTTTTATNTFSAAK